MSIQSAHPTFISDEVIDGLIREDVPYFDLTTWVLGLKEQPGRIEFISREDAVLAGSEEAHRVLARLGLSTTDLVPSGTRVSPGQRLLAAEGRVDALHLGWKVSLNILEHASGIATRTRKLVDLAHAANPRTTVVTTRKVFPGTKDLATKAALAGGALPHRLGLSETILIFEQHRAFLSAPGLAARIQELKTAVPEKKLLVEVASPADAVELAQAGVDGVQFDKISPEEIRAAVQTLRALRPNLVIIAAGGVTDANAAAYAAAGVDTLATSWVYFGKPADIKVNLSPLSDGSVRQSTPAARL